MTDEPELLPCPFCGGEAEIVRLGDRRRSTQYNCTMCGCFLETGEDWGHGTAWNRRAALPVRVAPLVWEYPCSANNHTHIAHSIFGAYYVAVDGGRHQAWLEAHTKPYEVIIGDVVGRMGEAKAAAQADHDARIRAALEE